MKRIVKWIAVSLIVFLTLLLVGSFINHTIRSAQEETLYPPPGQMVAVGDHKLHVYSEGERSVEGPLTLVFLSGSGTSAPTLDFKALYGRLSDEYRIAVVERAGYGWSEIGNTPRDIDTVLAETRLALQLAGESPPYVLFPHSMAGLEALYWANLYPEEVVAIVGLDPALPQTYEVMSPPPQLMLSTITFAARTGVIRSGASVCHEFAAVSEGHLTAEETAVFCSLFYRRTLTPNMLAEIRNETNPELVAAEGIPDVPLYFFISNGEDIALDNWGEILAAYAVAANGQYLALDVPHYLHNYAPDVIAAESRAFIKQVLAAQRP